MAHLNFRQDLVLGNNGEKTVRTFLEANSAIFINENHDNKYDLKMLVNGLETTYEIKTDVLCTPTKDTGNIFIEFKCRNKPSGIEVSEADWFVTNFKHLNELWFIKTTNLKKLIKENKFRVIVNGGDVGSNTHGYLINRALFKHAFKTYYCFYE